MTDFAKEIQKKAKALIKKREKVAISNVALGMTYSEIGDLVKAEKYYLKALNDDSNCAEAYAGLGMVFSRKGEVNKSISNFTKSLSLTPTCGLLANWIADAYFDLGELDKAIEYYNTATRLNSFDSNAHNDLADTYRLKGEIDKAIEYYDKTLNIDPFDTNAMLEKAQCFFLKEDNSSGLRILEQVIERFSDSKDAGTAASIAGTVYSKLDDHQSAHDSFERALIYFPFNTRILFHLAVTCIALKKNDEAEEYLAKIPEIDPSDTKSRELMKKLRSK